MTSQATAPPADCSENQERALVGGTITLLTVSCIFVFARVLVRTLIVKKFWWDDATIIFALLGTIVGAGLDFVEFDLGYGEWIQTFATLMWTKVSICLFLYQIPVSKAHKRPLMVAVVLLVVSNLVLTLLWILQCTPVNAAWDMSVQGRCFTKAQLLQIILAQGIISAISDFGLAFYPILILARLQISLRKKLAVWLLMGLGVITGACCIVRITLNWSNESPDTTWDSIPNWYWRLLEVNFGIAAACLPAIYPLFSMAYKKVSPQSYSKKASTSSPAGKQTRDVMREQDPHLQYNTQTSCYPDPRRSFQPLPGAAIFKSTDFNIRRSPETNSETSPDGRRLIVEDEAERQSSADQWSSSDRTKSSHKPSDQNLREMNSMV